MKNNLKDKILEEAFSLFLNQGYEETTTREISKNSGVERGHLYYYYPKKEDILFDIYSAFLNSLYDYTIDKFDDLNNGLLVMTITNMIYYKMVYSDARITSLLNSILSNQSLVSIKIVKTYETYKQVSDDYNMEDHDNNLLTITSMIIGAEAQLTLCKENEIISISNEEIGKKIIDLDLALLHKCDEESDEIYNRAKTYVDKIDFNDFLNYMKNNYDWVKGYSIPE